MGNAHSISDDTPNQTCTERQCGPRLPTVKRQHPNLLASAHSMEAEEEARQQDNTSRSSYVLKTIKTTIKNTIKDILDPPEPERLPSPRRPKPKQLLHGCTNAEEHYAYIDMICQKVANLQGLEGLEAMGFEYRMVHHPKNCECVGMPCRRNDEDDDLTDSEADPDEMKEGYMEESEDGDNDSYGQFDTGSDEAESASFMVPIGSPLKIPEEEQKLETIISSPFPNTRESYSTNSTPAFSRNSSALSLFSLATHNTDFSNPTRMSSSSSRTPRKTAGGRFPLSTISSAPTNMIAMEQDSCALRLHHTASNTMITAKNHSEFMADGKFYDELARVCMEHAQQVMMEEANLEWVTVQQKSDDEGEPKSKGYYGAMATKYFFERRQIAAAKGNNNRGTKKRKILLVVTGKGQVQAGIFSRRHLLVTSMEAATALPFIRGAIPRDMDIVMLDPNALGYRNGMDVVERSLEHFFLTEQGMDENEEIFILAHSMAGAQIVRFFIDNSSCHHDGNSSAASNGTAAMMDKKALRSQLLQRIQAFAFTDSNHNINWIKNHPPLMEALTGPPSLYIKSHKVHEKAKDLGEAHHDCQFWRHRFGDIKTLWAGTHEHALTNYTARAHIWEHFDQVLKQQQQTRREQQEQQQLPPKSPAKP